MLSLKFVPDKGVTQTHLHSRDEQSTHRTKTFISCIARRDSIFCGYMFFVIYNDPDLDPVKSLDALVFSFPMCFASHPTMRIQILWKSSLAEKQWHILPHCQGYDRGTSCQHTFCILSAFFTVVRQLDSVFA